MWADLEPTVRMLSMICVGLVVVMMLGAATVEADVCEWISVWDPGVCTSSFTPTGDYSGTQEVTCTGGYTLELVCYSGGGGSGDGGATEGGGGGSSSDYPPDTPEEQELQNENCEHDDVDCGPGLIHNTNCCLGNTKWGELCTTCDCGRCCIAEWSGENPLMQNRRDECQYECQSNWELAGALGPRGQDDRDTCAAIWNV